MYAYVELLVRLLVLIHVTSSTVIPRGKKNKN